MIQPWQMTPRHRWLETRGRIMQSTTTLRAGLPEGTLEGRDSDGETDLTALLGPQLVNAPDLRDMGDEWVRQVGDTACLLMADGADPFVANAEGENGFDLGAWLEHPAMIQAMLTHPDRPEINALLERKPVTVSARFSLALPTVWAMWARANTADALCLAVAQGGTLPADILGWAHPRAVGALLELGAAASDDTETRWHKRVRQGDLTVTQMLAMQAQCASGVSQQKVLRNGDDLVRLVNHNSNEVDLIQAIKQFGPMGHLTTLAQVEWGQKKAQWPLLARLFAIQANGQTVRRGDQLLATLNATFGLLSGDPQQQVGHTGHAMSSVARMMTLYLQTKIVFQNSGDRVDHTRSLTDQVNAWAGPVDWQALMACADTTEKGRLFRTGDINTIAVAANQSLFVQAQNLLAHSDHGGAEGKRVIDLATSRVQQADQVYGFWDDKLHRILDCSSNAQHPHRDLMAHLTPTELFWSLLADRQSSNRWALAEANMLEILPRVQFDSVGRVEDVLTEMDKLRGAAHSEIHHQIVEQLLARRREVKAGDLPELLERRRPRSRG